MQSEAVKKLEIVKLVLKAASEDVRPAEPHWHNDFLAMAVKRIEEVQALAAQSPASAVEVVTVEQLALNILTLDNQCYASEIADGLMKRYPNGLKIAPLKSPEGV